MKQQGERNGSRRVPLPDLCTAQALLAVLLVAALTVLVMQLAPGHQLALRPFSVVLLFAVWLATLVAVLLCKLRPGFERLPGVLPYFAAWALMVALAYVSSALVGWIDHALRMGLTPASAWRFALVNATLVALIGAALLRYFYVLTQWRQRLAAVSRAQVQALQARIRPHFLFNSMNTVAALIRVDPDAAERTVEDLAELFRAALASEGEGTLGAELALIDRYLAIEQLRLGPRLQVERDLDGLPADLALPRLLLQPLVENAIRHGVQPLREGGCVRLSGCRDGDAVEIVVDNPLPPVPAPAGTGHGLESVRQRIGYHFGDRGRLEVARSGGRFRVTVRLPLATGPHVGEGS